MECDFSAAEAVITNALGRVFPAAQIEVRQRGEVLWSAAYRLAGPRNTQPADAARYALRPGIGHQAVRGVGVHDAGRGRRRRSGSARRRPCCRSSAGQRPIRPYDDPLRPGATVAVAWEGAQPTAVDAGRVTFRHLLTHTSGLPAWRPLYKEGSPDAARHVALTTYFSYPTGARIIYSDIGLILIGMVIESLTGQPLDEAVNRRVTEPLGLADTLLAGQRISKSANQQSSDAQSAISTAFARPHRVLRVA